MVFSSIVFLFYFLPAALLLYHAAPRSLRFVVLTGVSYVFYAWADPRFVLLLLWTTFFDFVAGNILGGHWRVTRTPLSPAGRKVVLGISLTNSLGLLLFFKYGVLAQDLYNHVLTAAGGIAAPLLHIVLPAGISFYTFESISYIVDIYRGKAQPASVRFAIRPNAPASSSQFAKRSAFGTLKLELKAFLAFACYLAQFPHLVAGPIIRYQELEPQLHAPDISATRFARGILFFSFGLAKKVLLANAVAPVVDRLYNGSPLGYLDAAYCLLAYAFQIYFDFSGYSDMAVGLALMLGFDFPKNFDAPYRARSISEFWRRWHITLSTWLRDYLYIPLGGSRHGAARTYVALILTMLLGGLWHGAAFNFALWGLYHGMLLATERALGRRSLVFFLPGPLQTLVTFTLVCFGWAVFRAPDTLIGIAALMRMAPFLSPATVPEAQAALYGPLTVAAMGVAAICAFSRPQAWDICQRLTPARAVSALVLLLASILALYVSATNPFLYFRF